MALAKARQAIPRQLVLFAMYPLLGVLTPILAMPVVTSQFGSEGWATVAIGLSLGAAGVVFVELAWGLDGPQRVARADQATRRALFQDAASNRFKAYCLVAVVEVLACLAVYPADWLLAWLFALAALTGGVSSAWFMAGLSRPGLALLVDSLPKAVGTLCGCVLMLSGLGLWTYALVLTLSGLASPLLAARILQYPVRAKPCPTTGTGTGRPRSRRLSFDAFGARVVSTLYLSLPTTLVALVATPEVVAQFSGADRLIRMGLSGLSFIPTSLQASLARMPGSEVPRRARQLVVLNGAVGLAAGTLVAVALPLAVRVTMSGTVQISRAQALVAGILVTATCTSRATGGLVLVRLGQFRSIFLSAVTGASIGVPLLLLLARSSGATGAFAAVAASEVVVAVTQLRLMRLATAQKRKLAHSDGASER